MTGVELRCAGCSSRTVPRDARAARARAAELVLSFGMRQKSILAFVPCPMGLVRCIQGDPLRREAVLPLCCTRNVVVSSDVLFFFFFPELGMRCAAGRHSSLGFKAQIVFSL